MPDEKRRFRDTKFGNFLRTRAPKILEDVGDLLPESGVFGVVKNLIDQSQELSPADKTVAHQYLKELIEIEAQDRASARNREIEMAKSGKADWLFVLTGLIGLGVFIFIVYTITYLEIPKENKELFIHLIGISEGIVISIFSYYFGSSIKKNVL
jgi:hypothetical protein